MAPRPAGPDRGRGVIDRAAGFLRRTVLAAVAAVAFTGTFAGSAAEAVAAGGPHVHGEAELDLVIEERGLYLELVAPAETLVGFETEPRNAEQQQVLAQALVRLHVGSELLVLPESCLLIDAEVRNPFPEPPIASAADRESVGDPRHHAHADFVASYRIRCREPLPRALEIRLFAGFPRLEKLHVQYLTERGQGRATLVPGNPVLRW